MWRKACEKWQKCIYFTLERNVQILKVLLKYEDLIKVFQ